MLAVNKKKCTACGACVQKCPQKCICLEADELGFLYPRINTADCISCNMCEKVCPIGKKPDDITNDQKAYAVVYRDERLLMAATSGGAFGAIAEYIFSVGGVVYGVAYSENLKAQHIRIDTPTELCRINGSKYVQSDTDATFFDAERDLKSGKTVLYSGTPCQIAGLIGYLGKKYDNLITVDIICHGVPSQSYFDKFVEFLSGDGKKKIENIAFRSKKNKGQSVVGTYSGTYSGTGKSFEKKFNYYDNYYYFYFLKSGIYRTCCYSCDYANLNRMGDFSLGDFWGAEGETLDFDISNGCSLVLTNTAKAEAILSKLNINCKEIPVANAAKYNEQLRSPSAMPSMREELLRQYRENSAWEIQKVFKKNHRKAILVGKLKYLVPKKMRNFLLKKRYR